MSGYLRRALTAVALAGATALPAQPPEPSSDEVVVTGRRETDAEIRDFVGALTEAPVGTQLSRFETREVCPTTVGVTPGQRQAVIARLRTVAGAAGVPLAKEKCVPNVLVIVTADKRAFMEALIAKHRYLLGELSSDRARKLANDPSPAAAWQLAGPQLKGDGQEIWTDYELYPTNQTSRAASRIALPARPQFAAAAVVIEARALDGLTTIQLADYAAMRTFARTEPARLADLQAPTILKVLDTPMGGAVPITLTTWDLGFLKALYGAPANVTAASQRSAMRKSLTGELAKPSPAGD